MNINYNNLYSKGEAAILAASVMADEARWYIVHTYSGYENKVASNIEKMIEAKGWNELIKEIKIPTKIVTEIKDKKEKKQEVKLFPSYVFINMVLNNDTWYGVKNTRGVTGFLGAGSKPQPLTESEILQFGAATDSMQQYTNVAFDKGSNVIITSGPLEGREAVVEDIYRDKGVAKVLINMFGRKVSTKIEFINLKLIV